MKFGSYTQLFDQENPKGILVLGFGGHARSVADVAIALGIDDLLFIDQNAKPNETFLGFPVTSKLPEKLADNWSAFPASGDNTQRQKQTLHLRSLGWSIATIVAPTATLGVGSRVEPGTFVGHHCHIGPMAEIGTGCIVNSAAVVEHECKIGHFSHISVNATVAGRSKVGEMVMIGAGASVIDSIEIASCIVVGAGCVVSTSLTEPGVYVGVPAKRI